jgi:hypothetical protein
MCFIIGLIIYSSMGVTMYLSIRFSSFFIEEEVEVAKDDVVFISIFEEVEID